MPRIGQQDLTRDIELPSEDRETADMAAMVPHGKDAAPTRRTQKTTRDPVPVTLVDRGHHELHERKRPTDIVRQKGPGGEMRHADDDVPRFGRHP